MSSGRCGLCGNKFGQRAEEIVHSDCVDEMNRKVDRLRERLDQFEAYGFPNVAAALDRVNAAESRLAAEREAHEETTKAMNVAYEAMTATESRLAAAEAETARWRRELSAACELSERARSIVQEALNQPPEYHYDHCDNGEWSAEHAAHAIRVLFEQRDSALADVKALQEEMAARETEDKAVAAGRLFDLEALLRNAARELTYVHMHETVGGPDLVHTSEGDAVIALAEKLLGPMAQWPDEPSAQSAFLAGEAKP